MFTRKESASIQNQHTAMLQQRKGRADACFQTGLVALLQAHEHGFKDPMLSRQACEAFIEAIRHKRSEVRPYLMLAYLFAVHESYPTAWQYLKAAHDLAPAHPEVAHFRRHLQAFQQGDKTEAETEQDQEYQAMELRLKTRIQSLERRTPPGATADPDALAEMEENHKRFLENHDRLAARIDALSASFDTGSLHKLLQQLAGLWHPYEWALRASRVLTALKDEIQQTQFQVSGMQRHCLVAKTPEDFQLLEAELEELLDRCEAFTDVIEMLGKRGIHLPDVESVHRNLIGQAEAFRELLDERSGEVAPN